MKTKEIFLTMCKGIIILILLPLLLPIMTVFAFGIMGNFILEEVKNI